MVAVAAVAVVAVAACRQRGGGGGSMATAAAAVGESEITLTEGRPFLVASSAKGLTLAGDRPNERPPIKVVDGCPWSPGVYRALQLQGKPLEVAWEKAFICCSHF